MTAVKSLDEFDIKDFYSDIKKLASGDPLLSLIGNTPIIQLSRLQQENSGEIFIKLEGCNPSGSLKDRPALFMIDDAVRKKHLRQGMRILDASSGNMASAIAMVAKRLGYETSFVLGNTLTKEKESVLKLFDAEIIRFDGNTWQCFQKASELAYNNPNKYCFLNQFHNPANLIAHYETTGPEIFRDVPDADIFIASLGSGGSICGAGRFLKEKSPDIKIMAVTAETGTRIPGLRNLEEEGFMPPLADMSLFDDIIRVNETHAIKTVRHILKTEGILLGYQGGAVIWAALQALNQIKNKKIVVLIGDASWKNINNLINKVGLNCPEVP